MQRPRKVHKKTSANYYCWQQLIFVVVIVVGVIVVVVVVVVVIVVVIVTIGALFIVAKVSVSAKAVSKVAFNL